MNTPHLIKRKEQHGAALIVALILLLVLTLLGISSMNSANLELIMTGNEQFRANAQQAALTGNEVVINAIQPAPQAALDLTGIPKGGTLPNLTITNQAIANTGDIYSSTTIFLGEGAPPEQNALEIGTGGKLTALYYQIDTTAISARNAQVHVVQTIGLIAPK